MMTEHITLTVIRLEVSWRITQLPAEQCALLVVGGRLRRSRPADPREQRCSGRFDAVLYDKANKPIAAWDFKTGSAKLTTTRIEKMQKAIGAGVPIYEIR